MLFDCLGLDGGDLMAKPLSERRAVLDAFHAKHHGPSLLLSPCGDIEAARSWLAQSGGALDGVVAKRIDDPYRPGEHAMLKVKQHRICGLRGRRVPPRQGWQRRHRVLAARASMTMPAA